MRKGYDQRVTTLHLAELSGNRPGPQTRTDPAGRRLLYVQVIDLIEQLVVERGLGPGDLLPTQSELASEAGVSLITVRRALEELERAGRVRRHQGLGTFLAKPKIITEPGRSGGLLGTLGYNQAQPDVVTSLLALERGIPSADLRRVLSLDSGEEVWRVHRQRMVSGRPSILENAHIPLKVAPDLDSHREQVTDSLYSVLGEHYGLEDADEEQYLSVTAPSALEARLLNLNKRDLVARLRGLSTDAFGVAFDCFEQVYPAADFSFCISAGGDRRLVAKSDMAGWDIEPSTR